MMPIILAAFPTHAKRPERCYHTRHMLIRMAILVSITVFGSPTPRAAEGREMTGWEYVTVRWSGHNAIYGDAENLLVSVSDGTCGKPHNLDKATKMSALQFSQLMNKFGSEGWEMVNTYVLPVGSVHCAWLKRAKG